MCLVVNFVGVPWQLMQQEKSHEHMPRQQLHRPIEFFLNHQWGWSLEKTVEASSPGPGGGGGNR
jgi:hypothetical protein